MLLATLGTLLIFVHIIALSSSYHFILSLSNLDSVTLATLGTSE